MFLAADRTPAARDAQPAAYLGKVLRALPAHRRQSSPRLRAAYPAACAVAPVRVACALHVAGSSTLSVVAFGRHRLTRAEQRIVLAIAQTLYDERAR
jgi:hypothetical protein